MESTTMDDKTNIRISIIVWLDAEVNINKENQEAQQQLRTIINDLKTFESRDECEQYIQSISSQERLLLIVSGRLGRELVPDIHSLPQVTSIYVYCRDQKENERWATHFTKVKAVIIQLDELISQIKTDQATSLVDDGKPTTSSCVVADRTVPSTSEVNLLMVYSHLLSNALLRIKPTETDKHDLISLCEDIYKNFEFELKIIREFQQTYSSNKALWWYTNNSFIYKTLNTALQTHDVNTIFLFQFFIQDLYQQMTECQCKNSIKVYRAEIILHEEINSLKQSVGCFISIDRFFSTDFDRNRVLDLMNTCVLSDDSHQVLFEIDADPAVVTTKPFADISKYNNFPDGGEVLFAIGSFFRITSVQQSNDRLWIIQMTLHGDHDPDLKSFFDEMMQKYGYYDGEVALLLFSRVLREMQKFDEAENYCHRLLQNFSANDSLLSVLYEELAHIASSKGDYDLSDEWQQKSIEIIVKMEPDIFGNSTEVVSDNGANESSDIRDIKDSESISAVLSSVTPDQHQSENNWRFMDVAAENHEILLPIEGHEKKPLVTLDEAVRPLIPILPDIRRKAHTAKLKCKNPADGLTSDESAAIMLYTMQWEPQDQCLYFALNAHLRTVDRNILKPWFLYLKLILTGLSRLPSIQRTVYRGVKLDLSSKYPEGEEFFWWGFSSCTTTLNVLKSNQFLGNSGIRTLFHIECVNGKDIRRHSYFGKEDEILLLPATYLEVISCFEMAPGLHTIQLKEIISEFPYLEPVI